MKSRSSTAHECSWKICIYMINLCGVCQKPTNQHLPKLDMGEYIYLTFQFTLSHCSAIYLMPSKWYLRTITFVWYSSFSHVRYGRGTANLVPHSISGATGALSRARTWLPCGGLTLGCPTSSRFRSVCIRTAPQGDHVLSETFCRNLLPGMLAMADE